MAATKEQERIRSKRRYAALKLDPVAYATKRKRDNATDRQRAADPIRGPVRRAYQSAWHAAVSVEEKMWRNARDRAAKEGVPFDLAIEDIHIPTHDPIFGELLVRRKGKKGPLATSPTLDRIIPALGYVRGNIAVLSHRTNRLKNNMTADELIRIAIWIKHNAGTNG